MNGVPEFYIMGCRVYENGRITVRDVLVSEGRYEFTVSYNPDIPAADGRDMILAPSFCDLHTHLREPGFSEKETIKSGTTAAARGGFTTVCAMPNLNPIADDKNIIAGEKKLIKDTALIEVLPYAAITLGEKGETLTDIVSLHEDCCGFSDDGKGIQNAALMKQAMLLTASVGGFIAAHAEDEGLLKQEGAVNDGEASKRYGLVGMPAAAEYKQVERDLILAGETNCRYHVCHISAKESVNAVRYAKKTGVKVTCEVTPHHLALSETDITEDSGRFKMNPPLRSEDDRQEIISAIADGAIDVIATDHAPHTYAEKAAGLSGSAFGTVGSETAFAVCNTFLVERGIINYERLLHMMCDKPREILGKKTAPGWVLLDTKTKWKVNPERFLSKGKSTPFEGMELTGDVVMTVINRKVVYFNRGLLHFDSEKKADS